MAGKIFINYRRGQTLSEAQHLATLLSQTFGTCRIFIDVRGIEGFSHWLTVLKDQVAGTAAMISVIGPGWADLRDKDGKRRLDNPEDFVRYEIREALSRDIPVFPVLLDGAELPAREDLPEDMRGMLRRQGMDLRAKSFPEDAKAIARRIKQTLANGKRGVPVWAAAAMASAALAGGIYAGPFVLTQMGVELPWVEAVTDKGLRQELAAAASAADRAEKARQDAEAKLAQAERNLSAARRDLATARAELEKAKARSGEIAADLDEARGQLKEAEARAEAAEAAKNKAESGLAELRKKPPAFNPNRANKPLEPSELAALKAGNEFKECDACPQMAVVPEGEFSMGSPKGEAGRSEDEDDKPGEGGEQVRVKIGKPFAVGKFEVTVREYTACVDAKKCRPPEWLEPGSTYNVKTGSNNVYKKFGAALTGDNYPIIGVSWDDATEYTKYLAEKTGHPYRLLSEAEWEYAARAKNKARFSFGDDEKSLERYAWYSLNAGGKTWQVGQKLPNDFGLHDMHGNVWEWVQDCYADSYKGAPRDGSAANVTKDCRRVLRGGSWSYNPITLRSAFRLRYSADFRYFNIGFRVARTL